MSVLATAASQTSEDMTSSCQAGCGAKDPEVYHPLVHQHEPLLRILEHARARSYECWCWAEEEAACHMVDWTLLECLLFIIHRVPTTWFDRLLKGELRELVLICCKESLGWPTYN